MRILRIGEKLIINENAGHCHIHAHITCERSCQVAFLTPNTSWNRQAGMVPPGRHAVRQRHYRPVPLQGIGQCHPYIGVVTPQ
jgi:hypothetical protein